MVSVSTDEEHDMMIGTSSHDESSLHFCTRFALLFVKVRTVQILPIESVSQSASRQLSKLI